MHDLLPDWTDMPDADREARVRELILEGKSASIIARHFRCCTRSAVIGFCNRRGIAMANRSGWSKEAIKKGREASSYKAPLKAKAQPKPPKPPKPVKIKAPAFETAPLPEEELGNDVTRYTLLEASDNQGCMYCTGDPLTASHSFCNQPRKTGTPWCDHHYGIVYKAVPA